MANFLWIIGAGVGGFWAATIAVMAVVFVCYLFFGILRKLLEWIE